MAHISANATNCKLVHGGDPSSSVSSRLNSLSIISNMEYIASAKTTMSEVTMMQVMGRLILCVGSARVIHSYRLTINAMMLYNDITFISVCRYPRSIGGVANRSDGAAKGLPSPVVGITVLTCQSPQHHYCRESRAQRPYPQDDLEEPEEMRNAGTCPGRHDGS